MSAIELQHIIKILKRQPAMSKSSKMLASVPNPAVFRWCLGRLVQEKVRF